MRILKIGYSRASKPSAIALAEALADLNYDVTAVRSSSGVDINWGRRGFATAELNPDTSGVTNKRVMRGMFAEAEVPMPELFTEAQVRDRIADGKITIGRSDRHTKGRGFWRIETERDLERALRGITYRNGKRKLPATHFMEYIEAPREYRVHIFNGKSLRISEKDFNYPTDKTLYTTRVPHDREVIKHVRRAAKRAVQAVGLDFGCVDVLADDTNCWVLEVNSAPRLEGGSMARVYAEAIKRYYEEEDDE